MQNYKPVPKVIAQTVAGVIAALVVAWLASQGIEDDGTVSRAVIALVTALLPVAVGAAAGWLKTDTERAELLKMLAELMTPEDDAHGDA